ncbi:MAG: flotillin family protein [Chitinophagales bacterium]|nr:flotillin family protein [Chitinophagales bacterium]
MITTILTAIAVLFVLFVLFNSFTIAKGDQIITLERRWFGAPMPDGRTVALKHEVGIQARILGPGFHWLIPFIYKTTKHNFIVIQKNQVGVLRAITGAPIPTGQVMAKKIECDLFQDGEAFIKNGGEKGPQLDILPDGEYKINPHLFEVSIVDAIIVEDDEVAVIESIAGKQVERSGGNFGAPVECDNFQNAEDFLKNGGEKGPQINFLKPGFYRINKIMFIVEKRRMVEIPGGMIGLIEAADGNRIPEGRLLARKVEGHNNFFDGQAFITNGGERGRQIDVLMPGKYRINTALFKVIDIVPWTSIQADQVGIVTVKEGLPIVDPTKIAAEELGLNVHNNFQDPAGFLAANGQKGLQIPVLRAGNYSINPWFADVEKVDMTRVDIGFCGVVTSFVGEEGEDVSGEDVNAKIVVNGKKGIWANPLEPGKHPLNTKVCKVDIVPTTQILLNWADNTSSAHQLDSNLSTITLRTADAFSVNMDVSVIIHIPMKNAPKVIANLGSVKNMISQVLEPAISSHFRNAAQYIKALDLYTQRKELQAKAKEHIDSVLKVHHIDSKETLIADVVLPEQLIKPVTDRQIAEQEKSTYKTQREAQDERKALENSTAQANMQKDVVTSERGVEIAKNVAQSAVEKSTGEKESMILSAAGKAEAVKLEANAQAEATKVIAVADAEKIEKVGLAEAKIILEKGKSTAESYKLEVSAMGQDGFVRVRVMDQLTKLQLKLVPDTLIMGGGNGTDNSSMGQLISMALLEKVTGKDFLEITQNSENKTSKQETQE